MPLYEYRKNAENKVVIPPAARDGIVCGSPAVCERLVRLLRETRTPQRPATLAVDGWYGVDWAELEAGLLRAAKGQNLSLAVVSTAELFCDENHIDKYRQPYVSDDPSFGRVNDNGVIEDILDAGKVAALKDRLSGRTKPPSPRPLPEEEGRVDALVPEAPSPPAPLPKGEGGMPRAPRSLLPAPRSPRPLPEGKGNHTPQPQERTNHERTR